MDCVVGGYVGGPNGRLVSGLAGRLWGWWICGWTEW